MSPLLWLAVQAMALSQPLVVAHRGLSAGMPENTLPAFRHALDIGADAIELDLRPTADGQPVVIHDPTVDRTTNGTGTVSAMTLRQIQALDAGSKAGPGFAGERVPSYADVLTQLGPTRARLVIDIKTSRNMSLADIIRLTREHGMVDRVIVAVRTLEDLRRIKALEPRIQTLALIPTPITIDAFADAGADVIRLWSDWIDGDLASPVAPPAQGLIAAVRARGKKLWILVGRSVPPDGAKLRSLLQSLAIAPVDGVMTDAPEVLIDIERATRAGKSSCPATGSPVPASVGC
jgi:glycerophosphoryl diester phosphodiesterase